MRLRWLVLFLLACLWQGPARAQASVVLGNEGSYGLSRVFDHMEDPGGAMTLAQVLQPAAQARFVAVARDTGATFTNFGLTSSAIWLRADLRTPPGAPHEWLLEVAYPPLDRIDLYVPDGNGGYTHSQAGDTVDPRDRVPHRNHVLRASLPPGESHMIYMRIASQGPVSAPTRLWQPAALAASDQSTFAALSLYFGLLLGLLFYNLLLYLSVRDTAFLLYVAFAAGMGVAQASLTGFGPRFIWTDWSWWIAVSPNVGNSVAAVFGMLFARHFLASATRMPWIDRLVVALVVGWFVNFIAALTLPYTVSAWLSTVLAPVSVVALVTAGVQGVRLRHPGAGYFLGAWTMLLIGVAALTLHNTGLLPSNLFTANSLLIGSALEMVMLSFALGDRINGVRREKEQVQARIEAEHALVEALRESQERYKTLLEEREIILESSIVGIAFLTPEGRFRWANQAMLQIFAAGDQPITSMEPFYLSREQYLRVGGEVADAIRRGEVYEQELEVQQADGKRIWISLSGKAVSHRDLTQGTVWVIMDITRRKTLEAELKRTSSEREAILNSATVGIVLSVARRHEWVNDKFASMLGYPRQVLIGQGSEYIHADLDAWQQFGQEARASLVETGTYICERQLRRRDGSLLWVEMGGSCIRPQEPDSGVIWTFLDITERKRSEQESREALEQQKALNELRTRFVAMTSHEFRTPLAAILSAGELLRDYGDRLPADEKAELLDSIAAAVQRMSRMMDRVLLLGKADAQMLEFAPQPLDLVPLCRQFVDEAKAQHPDSASEVVTAFAPDLRRGLYDEKLLRHIFGNLLSNALKYSPGGGTVRFSVRHDDKGNTVFEVADQGIGIPADEITHLFESFHRASNVGDIQGTGLGLAIVKTAVDKHGGRIEVDSVPGEGTRFGVWLPPTA
ncbi:MAG: PAS domain S-box protein [Ramlibacter sp.]|nr:PAS domain S-box protein [Ramlibacter sp.]MBX3658173.1 PAS domain S-box protein [Ramlibacter sp.]MCW5648532.1 PAS domain S-box protein [Ramlibacter sp.]